MPQGILSADVSTTDGWKRRLPGRTPRTTYYLVVCQFTKPFGSWSTSVLEAQMFDLQGSFYGPLYAGNDWEYVVMGFYPGDVP